MEPLKIEQKRELEKQIINALAAITWAMKTGCREIAQERILELEKYIHGLPVLFCEHLIYCRELRRPTSETGPGLVCLLKSRECPYNARTMKICKGKVEDEVKVEPEPEPEPEPNPGPNPVDCDNGSCSL